MQYKKSLGQHILKNQGVLKKIADALGDVKKGVVIEIGGGTGNLTRFLISISASNLSSGVARKLPSGTDPLGTPAVPRGLLSQPCDPRQRRGTKLAGLPTSAFGQLTRNNKKIIVYEIDKNLSDLLRQKFPQIEVRNEDFLSADLKKFKNNYFLIGNIPYFITGKILRKIFNFDNYPKIAVLTISKEQGEKFIGLPHSNFWSNWIKAWGKIEKICVIKPGSFFPAPQIDSMAIKIEFYKKPLIENPENFAKFLKILFRRPKQTIKNNIKEIYNENKLSQINNLLNLRPHQLKFEEILKLYQNLNPG